MGLVRYDPAANNGNGAFRMTDVSGFIAGGVSECKRLITHEIQNYKVLLSLAGVLTGICGLFCGLIVYKKI